MTTVLMACALAAGMLAPVAQAPSQPASARSWTMLRIPELGFALEFPGEPKRTTIEGGHAAWALQLDNNWTAYLLTTLILTDERLRAGQTRILEDAVDGGLRRFPGATVLSRTSIQLAGYEGRELSINTSEQGTTMRIVSRVILVQNRLYVWTAVVRETMPRGEMDRFLKSFALIGN